ncbi:MAG: leucyl aminopeptidase [Caulobacterales bacterium]|nr:leucyl aminopeptidase [Caulobacterales bacterium]
MQVEFVAVGAEPTNGTALAVFAFEGGTLSAPAAALDSALGGALSRAVAAGRFKGSKGQSLELLAPQGVEASRVLLIGLGPEADLNGAAVESGAASAYAAAKLSGATELLIRHPQCPTNPAARAAKAAFGARLASYRFDRYRTTEKADKKPSITTVKVAVEDAAAAQAAYAPLAALGDAIVFSRDLVSEPANILYPAEYARRAKELESLGLKVEVLGEDDMAKLGMGSLLGVGQGSRRESQLVVMQWLGAADPASQPIAFVGKGVTFDTGGISIKPADGMEDMKWDMGGSAAVIGLMHALAGRKAKVNAIGVLGLVENMPDGNAQRPGDIVTSMSGQTIEVINTDAEGRLVLADALWYTQDRFKPQFMVDLATLTGAIIIALGKDYAGLYANDDALADKLLAASKAENELLWRMPLPAAYEKQIESLAADMKNVGGRPGGSITAALFLQKYVAGLPWAHLDIAGVAWRQPSSDPTIPEGAAGFGVRLLNRLVADNYEG